MRPPVLDPTAGASARAIQRDPTTPRRIVDPTSPRNGEFAGGEARLNCDPTDPDCGAVQMLEA